MKLDNSYRLGLWSKTYTGDVCCAWTSVLLTWVGDWTWVRVVTPYTLYGKLTYPITNPFKRMPLKRSATEEASEPAEENEEKRLSTKLIGNLYRM